MLPTIVPGAKDACRPTHAIEVNYGQLAYAVGQKSEPHLSDLKMLVT